MQYIRFFADIGLADLADVGGKNASLGELYAQLSNLGVRVPEGFATRAQAYRDFIAHNDLDQRITAALAALDVNDVVALAQTGTRIRSWISNADLPPALSAEIRAAYAQLEARHGDNLDVAVRSSATAEDLPDASFAGQQDTYLNIRGSKNLLHTCRRVFASLFTDRAIAYRVHHGFAHEDVALSIGVQKMVRADLGASGVIFTLDTESGFRDAVFITAAYGLGENIVQGKVNPDEFYVFKPTLASGHRPIIKRQLGEKAIKLVYTGDTTVGMSTRDVAVRQEERQRFALNDDEVLELARYAVEIERHYSKLHGRPSPMDIEWAKDGATGELFILQARPETVQSRRREPTLDIYQLAAKDVAPLATGKSVGRRIATGQARVILEAAHMRELQPGEVLVTDITDPDWEPVMKTAAAIVTNRGGRTCHAAIVARELGIPAVVGCGTATQTLAKQPTVTVSCAEGDTGYVYPGALHYDKRSVRLDENQATRTRLLLNVGNPDQAFEHAALPSAGVGLARLEFIINNSIRLHPMAALGYAELPAAEQREIDALCAGYNDARDFFIERLAEGVGMIAAAFYPRPVIVRLSDFKSNEYASLIGGRHFEPAEENPMLGLRGASRYFAEQFAAAFALECTALKKVREDMGLDNVALMIPFVRSVAEAERALAALADNGLRRGEHDLKVYLMCEIPANALLAEEFLAHFDGFSIGSNDLTQLTLGVDRDSGLVAGFDERNPAVLQLMERAIQACRRQHKYIGICGQAPSDYPEITRWLVERGIDSISLNPDSLLPMLQTVQAAEGAAPQTAGDVEQETPGP